MALVKCPECGQDRISDTAVSCPACGFGVKNYFDELKRQEQARIAREQAEQERINEINSIPMPEKPKFSLALIVYLCIAVIVYIYVCVMTYLLDHDLSDMPWGLLICLLIIFILVPLILGILFFKEAKDDYKLAQTNFPVYQIKKHASNKRYEAMQEQMKQEQQKKNQTPRCPVCGSSNVKRLSQLGKAVSAEAWGLGSAKIGKQYQCMKCKHLW